jgi:hypothetical protein
MICDPKWNNRLPGLEATRLLRWAIEQDQIGYPIMDGLPTFVWARDPEDPSVVFRAKRLSGAETGYYAYPMIEPEVELIGIFERRPVQRVV